MLTRVEIVISNKDQSKGYIEISNHPRIEPRVFVLRQSGFFDQCSESAFHNDGAMARMYGTNYKVEDFNFC